MYYQDSHANIRQDTANKNNFDQILCTIKIIFKVKKKDSDFFIIIILNFRLYLTFKFKNM